MPEAYTPFTAVRPDPRNPRLKQNVTQGERVKAVAKCLVTKGVQRLLVPVMGDIAVKKVQTENHRLMHTLLLDHSLNFICRERT